MQNRIIIIEDNSQVTEGLVTKAETIYVINKNKWLIFNY